jgi:hypothetical protein
VDLPPADPTTLDLPPVEPADVTPADGTPADGTPADGTPADGTPADAPPAGEAAPDAAPDEGDTLVYTSDSDSESDSGSGTGPGGGADEQGHLEQPLIDPGTVKAVQSEMATGQAAADTDKG